jgi:hypothetical protein
MPKNSLSGDASESMIKSPGRYFGPVLFLSVFALYLRTLAPGVTFWDSGELIFGASSLGIPHPPAYPVFCLLGKIFAFLPFGSFAYRINLLSAAFGAAAVWLVYLLVARLGEGVPGRHFAAVGAASCFAFFGPFWGITAVTEVYALNVFLLSSGLLFLLFYDRSGDVRGLYAASFFMGLTLANHQSIILVLPAFAAYALFAGSNFRRPVFVCCMAFFFMLAYSVNLYIPIRGAAYPALNIGEPVTLSNFIWVIKWTEYSDTLKAILSQASVPPLIFAAGAAAFLAVISYACSKARRYAFAIMLAASGLLYSGGIYLLTYRAEAIRQMGLLSKFYVPSLFYLILFASAVFFGAVRGKRAGAAPQYIAGGICAAAAVAMLVINFHAADNSRNFFAKDFAANTLKSVKQDGALFSWGDNAVFPAWYLQGLERYREDVFFTHTELLSYPWYMRQMADRLNSMHGLMFQPPATLESVSTNVPILRLVISKYFPTYYDFSTILQMKVPWEGVKPQGLVHMAPPADSPIPLGRIWDFYTIRGGWDGSTDRAFAAEGILDIYAWEAAMWAQQAGSIGRLDEAGRAYDLAIKLGMRNPEFDAWFAALKKKP